MASIDYATESMSSMWTMPVCVSVCVLNGEEADTSTCWNEKQAQLHSAESS